MILRAVDRADRDVTLDAIRALKRVIIAYQARKRRLPDAWFDVDAGLFVGFSREAVEFIRADRIRVEQKCLANPANGFLEYKIERLPDGRPLVKGGKPVAAFGPEDHLPEEVIEDYRGRRKLWGHTLRDNLAAFEPLRHPPLADTI